MLVNGTPQDFVDLTDRALHYGDGAFETLRVENGFPRHWSRHLKRLIRSCELLKLPIDISLLEAEVKAILRGIPGDCILKIIVSRGSGGRGYRPPENANTRRILSLHSLPADYQANQQNGIRLMRCKHPISENPALAGLKHLNRLDQVLASMELPSDCEEGVMLTCAGRVIEGTRTNVFLVHEGQLVTPALDCAGVAGIQREIILECCEQHGIDVKTGKIELSEFSQAHELFVCNSVSGIWPVIEWRDGMVRRHFEPGPLTRMVQELTRGAD